MTKEEARALARWHDGSFWPRLEAGQGYAKSLVLNACFLELALEGDKLKEANDGGWRARQGKPGEVPHNRGA